MALDSAEQGLLIQQSHNCSTATVPALRATPAASPATSSTSSSRAAESCTVVPCAGGDLHTKCPVHITANGQCCPLMPYHNLKQQPPLQQKLVEGGIWFAPAPLQRPQSAPAASSQLDMQSAQATRMPGDLNSGPNSQPGCGCSAELEQHHQQQQQAESAGAVKGAAAAAAGSPVARRAAATPAPTTPDGATPAAAPAATPPPSPPADAGELAPPAGASAEASGQQQQQQQQPAILSELGVSLDSLEQLLTGDCGVSSQQPVWMVVNLQGKIKGSYSASKMVEFSRRGTLSAAQLILGIDKDLPYVSRQELGFYRRVDHVLQAVHAGAVYVPLAQPTVDALSQGGHSPTKWQPLQFQPGLTAAPAGDGSSSSSTAAGAEDVPQQLPAASSAGAHEAAQAADTQLRLALQRLCGYSSLAGDDSSPTEPGSPAHGMAASSAVSPASPQTPSTAAAAAAAAAAVLSAGVSAEGGAAAACGPREAAGAGSSSRAGEGGAPVWLYINHLGWCRGPFTGDKMVQAHLCGRLPRDTLVVGLNPELPPSLLCMDVAYYFRPFGALLDNVAHGWTYRAVDWQDVTSRGFIKALQQQQQGQAGLPLGSAPQAWYPLVWGGSSTPPPLVTPEQLQPPTDIPAVQPGNDGQTGSWPGNGGNSASLRMPRRRRPRQQQQLQLQGGGPSTFGMVQYRHVSSSSSSMASMQSAGAASVGVGVNGLSEAACTPLTGHWHHSDAMIGADPHQHMHSPHLALQQHMLALQQQQQQQQQGYLGHMVSTCGPMQGVGGYSHTGHQQQHMGHAVLPAQQQQQQQSPWLLQQALQGVLMYGAGQHTAALHPPEQQAVLQVQESPQPPQLHLAAPFGSDPRLTTSPDHFSDGSGLEVISTGSTVGGTDGSVASAAVPQNNTLLLQLLMQQQQQLYELQHLADAGVGPLSTPSCGASSLEAQMLSLGLNPGYAAGGLMQQQQQQQMPCSVQLAQQLLLQQQQVSLPQHGMSQVPVWHQ